MSEIGSGGHRRPLAILPLLLGLIGALVFAAWVASGTDALYDFMNVGVYHLVLALAAVTCLAQAALDRAPRLAWLAFGVGLLCWTAGDVYWATVLVNDRPIQYPSWADAGYLAAFPCFYVGIALLIKHSVGRFTEARWLDGVIGALATGALGAAALAPALIGLTEGDASVVFTNLAYPLGDLFLIAMIVGALVASGRRGSGPLVLVGVGLLAWSFGDVVYLYQEATGSYASGWMDETWLVGSLLIGAAALVGSSRTVRPKDVHQSSIMPPIVFSMVAVGVLAWDHYDSLHLAAVWLSVATLGAVVLRLGVSFGMNKRLVSDLHEDSTTDSLTGLGNRRKLLTDLERVPLAAAGGKSASYTFALFDLDGFKSYNDTFGHPAGDALLSRLGARLVSMLPASAAVYRLGGDEFCFLVQPGAGSRRTILAAAQTALTETGEGFSIGASGGAVTIPGEASSASDALRLADQRMYRAKASSPGRVAEQTSALLRTLVRTREPTLDDHQHGVADLARATGRDFDLMGEQLEVLCRAAELHDIGKIAIPDVILNKPGPLTASEWDLMRKHTLVGARLLSHSQAMVPVADLVRSSHERWDGFGYPEGLAGEEIPFGSRIILVCDAFHAMTAGRPYQPTMSVPDALDELRAHAGTQFDPTVVERFASRMERGVRSSHVEAARA